jgi:F0F1-type ATP synthase epsilon subunit
MVKKITLNGDEGRVTFLPNHIDYITTFKSGILTYFDEFDNKKFATLDDGSFLKYKNKVRITTYMSFIGDNISKLREKLQEKNAINEEQKFLFENAKELDYLLVEKLRKIKYL